jgi:hypothetical protein
MTDWAPLQSPQEQSRQFNRYQALPLTLQPILTFAVAEDTQLGSKRL